MNLRFLLSCIFTVQVALLSITFIEAASIRKRREDDTVVSAAVSTSGEDNTEARIGINISPGGGITLPGTGTGQVINQNTVIKGPTAVYGGGGGGGKPKKPPGPGKCSSAKRCKNKIGKPRRPPRPVVQPHPVAGNQNPIAVYNGLSDEDSEDESENAHDESVESADVSEDEDADASVEQDQDANEEQDHEQEHDASEEQDANEEQDEDQPEAQPEADEDE